MTEQPSPDDAHEAQPEPSKGKGIGRGILTALGAVLGGFLLGAIVSAALGGRGVLAVIIAPLVLLVVAGLRWRDTPGFLLGMAITVGVSIAVATGCTAYLMGSSSPFG